MSNLDNITNKIREDAQAKALEIKDSYDQKVKDMTADYEAKIEDLNKSIISRANVDADNAKEKVISQARLAARDERLGAKQGVLNKTFDLAKAELRKISDEDYVNFVNNNLKDYKFKGSEELIPQKGKAGLLKGSDYKLSESESVEAGFAIRDGDVIVSYIFDDMVDFYRAEIEGEIASILFDGRE